MSAIDDAILALRGRLQAALYDQPLIRDKLGMADIATVADAAITSANVRTLLEGIVAAQAVKTAIAADIPAPPSSVTGALGDYNPIAVEIGDIYGLF
ncbi:hypothetical protein [Phenylobacterium sp.]|jgi:hypothetical protein|uniref:hypothetical protein n=1 Tax=Phenylobacterium sp. TaxID=1871053 RepID=UPI0037CC7226